MQPFAFRRPGSLEAAHAAGAGGARYLAGGTGLVDLMKLGVETPSEVVDLQALPLNTIEETRVGIRIGATVSNSTLAYHPSVMRRLPALSQALLSGASPQLRNMATTAGNLLQRTRCSYFRDVAQACEKRAPSSGCGAQQGYNRGHAILGGSELCIATHPSDMCVALLALDAVVVTRSDSGERRLPIGEFHTLPGNTPHIENILTPGELVVAVEVPFRKANEHSLYSKVRDRASYAFALASVAVAAEFVDGTFADVRIALGGVATKPWRNARAEGLLLNQPPSAELFRAVSEACVEGAKSLEHNRFKVALAKNIVVRALTELVAA